MNDLRVGLIGYGHMGVNHARVLNAMAGIDLVAILDEKFVCEDLRNRPLFFKDRRDFFLQNLDYCVVATPTATHSEVAEQLIEREMSFLMEKPFMKNSDDCKRISRMIKSTDIKVGVGQIERYNPALAHARNLINSGELGVIQQVSTIRKSPFSNRISDVGVILDLATHDFDLVRWITGVEYKKIKAFTKTLEGRRNEDFASISGLLDGQILVNHLVDWRSPVKKREIYIQTDVGALIIDTTKNDINYFETPRISFGKYPNNGISDISEGLVRNYAFDKTEPLLSEHLDFKNYILGKESNVVKPLDGLKTIEIAEAALLSANTGKEILL